jgi:hypothetical protein
LNLNLFLNRRLIKVKDKHKGLVEVSQKLRKFQKLLKLLGKFPETLFKLKEAFVIRSKQYGSPFKVFNAVVCNLIFIK